MKPPFEETLPVEDSRPGKPAFEDTVPLEESASSPWQEVATRAAKTALTAPYEVTKTMARAEPKELFKYGGSLLPVGGGIVGGPIGAATGEFARQLIGTGLESPDIPQTAVGRFGNVMLQGASFINPEQVIAEVPGVRPVVNYVGNKIQGVADVVGDVAKSAGRRALGFTKRFLTKPGNLERADEVAQTMLDEGVIRNPITHPFSSGSEATAGRIENLAEKSGQQMGYTRQVLDANGIAGPNASDAAAMINQQLNPRFADEIRIANEIGDDVKALGEGHLTFQDAFTVLKKLDQKAKYSPMGGPTDQLKANMYRRAYGILRGQLDAAVDRGALMLGDFTGKTLEGYQKAKRLFGAASDAEKAITNKLAAEAGNNRIGLREAGVAMAELAAGNPAGAAAAIGAIEGVKRFGNAGLATAANAVSKGIRRVPSLITRPAAIPVVSEAVQEAVAPGGLIPALASSPALATGSKILTEDKAREFLKRAKGDKQLARKMATQEGWIY